MTMTPDTKAQTVNALIGLAQLSDVMSGPREDAKKLTAVLSTTFITAYHEDGMTELQLKAWCESVLVAVRKRMKEPNLKEGELASAWRQYKSDTLKAIRMTADDEAVRLTHTTMSALKKFIGSGSTIGQLNEMMAAFTYHVKKGTKESKPVHLKFADDTLEVAMKAIAAYAEKHAISLVKPPKASKEDAEAPMVAEATKPEAVEALHAADAA